MFEVTKLNYLRAILYVTLASVIAMVLQRWLPHAGLTLLFLATVLLISAKSSTGPSILASLLSFFSLNFFFSKPVFTLQVQRDDEVATLFIFLVVSAITGRLAARMHTEIDERKRAIQRVSNFLQFSSKMSTAADEQAVYNKLCEHLNELTRTPVSIYTSCNSQPIKAGFSHHVINEDELAAAWSGSGSEPILQREKQVFFQLPVRDEIQAVIVIEQPLIAEQELDVRSLCSSAGAALERIMLVTELDKIKLQSETEQLRTALLSSISHDLRTPLSSIIGGTESVLAYGDTLSRNNRNELLATVLDEAKRLDRHIQNLLDMTRLSHGELVLQRDWVDIRDIISSAISRLAHELAEIKINLHIDSAIPILWVQGALIEQAVVNLLDNAARFTPMGQCIDVFVYVENSKLIIDIYDQGPGIPKDEHEKVFDMFYSVQRGDRRGKSGTGLGLAIVKGMIVAHGGEVEVHDNIHAGKGTCMRIILSTAKQTEAQ